MTGERFIEVGHGPGGAPARFAAPAARVTAHGPAEAAGALDLGAVIAAMHNRQFDTVLGRIGFDEKGDVTGFEPWGWYVWQADGTYLPLEPSVAKK